MNSLLAQADDTTPLQHEPTDPGGPGPLPTQAVYLALGVSLLLFLALFVLIGMNVVRRIQRRRAALDAPHAPRRPPNTDSPWATAGKRAKPLDDDDDLEDTAM